MVKINVVDQSVSSSKSCTELSTLPSQYQVIDSKNQRAKPPFQLLDASVRGGEVLISNPRKWQLLEDEHLAANLH
jgi:hypothetical protein